MNNCRNVCTDVDKAATLSTRTGVRTSKVLPSNDSEVIAELLKGFEYNPEKTEQVLNKYRALTSENRGRAKVLSLKRK